MSNDPNNEFPKTTSTPGHGGLTYGELVVACKNIGFDLTCGACASLFYTGSSDGTPGVPYEHTCQRWGVWVTSPVRDDLPSGLTPGSKTVGWWVQNQDGVRGSVEWSGDEMQARIAASALKCASTRATFEARRILTSDRTKTPLDTYKLVTSGRTSSAHPNPASPPRAEQSDKNCISTGDGNCISNDCMHTSPPPRAKLEKELEDVPAKQVDAEIRHLWRRSYVLLLG